MKKKKTVLFLCSGNSCRSQMAEGFLRREAGDRFEVLSCGLEARPVHPLTIEVMQEVGIDLVADGHRPQVAGDYLGKISVAYLIIVCDRAARNCPKTWPGALNRLIWPFDDPARAAGEREWQLAEFRRVRDEIAARIREWLQGDGVR